MIKQLLDDFLGILEAMFPQKHSTDFLLLKCIGLCDNKLY